LTYTIPTSGDIGTGGILTLGAPSLDFTLASGSICSGHFDSGGTCTVNVTFAPMRAGSRTGVVRITDDFGNVLATTSVYGTGFGPQFAFDSAAQTTVGAGLSYPFGIAVDGLGDAFISDELNNRVVKVPAGGGARTAVGSGLIDPQGIAVDGSGNVFINDTGNDRTVEVLAASGAQITVDTGIYAPNTPGGIAVDGAGDLFITADFAGVLKVPAGGGPLVNVGTGLKVGAVGVAVDAAGNVFIAGTGNNRVVEVPIDGSAQTTVASGLSGPTGLPWTPRATCTSPMTVTIGCWRWMSRPARIPHWELV
jgi:sugar lactone lactonase YvrE